MAKQRDDIFSRAGVTWQRIWVGDNGGQYEWRAGDLVAWRDGRVYRFSVGGIASPNNQPTLSAAMGAATLSNIAKTARGSTAA